MGGAIVAAIAGQAFAATFAGTVMAFAINMVASTIISKLFAPDAPSQTNATPEPNPGNRQQLPPAGDNKLPVIYGTAYTGGIMTDLSISTNNQDLYYVFSLCEVTNTETGGTPDSISFGNVYWGGKRCIFGANGKVTGLLDESLYDPGDPTAGVQDISGYMDIYLYSNGSSSGWNTGSSAIGIMSATNLLYKWNGYKLMTNTAFAIVHIKYSQSRGITGLQQTRFQVINSRTQPGDCFLDYFSSTRYGAAIPLSQIDTASLTALNTYCSGNFTYTTYTGGTGTIPRFTFNGLLDTNRKIMQNIQSMSDCCDCLVKYNEIVGEWAIVVQSPDDVPVMDLNDSNIISSITVSPIDLSNSFNVIEVKFPDGSEKDTFNSSTFDLATLAPELLFPNEPVNKQSVSLYLTNDNVTAQFLANRMLKSAREDLQLTFDINYQGLQLEAGDIVTVTNTNYGWDEKLFRIMKVTEKFNESGQVSATLNLSEYNPDVYADVDITQFTPAPNTGIGTPTAFGNIPIPIILNQYPSITNPAFDVQITSSSAGITQYAELWYSAYEFPTESQLFLAAVSEIQSNGDPYDVNTTLPPIQLFNIPAGNWYFFSKMVNALAESNYSDASLLFRWRPTTFQFSDRYIAVAYADDVNGTGFSLSPRNKSYFGLLNQTGTSPSLDANDYNWYIADPNFGTNIYLAYANRTGRKFSFDTDFAVLAGGGGAFVPATASKFDPRVWSALEDGINYIDLDQATGQVLITGSTTVGTGEIAVTNNPDGRVIASLAQFLDFGGSPTFTGSAATLTIDIYGRVLGFTSPDEFYYTSNNYVATAGQTIFTPVARQPGYINGQDLILQNGLLLSTSEYTETTTTVTLNTGANAGDQISIISMRAVSTGTYYEFLHVYVDSVASNVVTWALGEMPFQYINIGDIITFDNTGTPTQYTVTGVDYANRQITVDISITASNGDSIYRYRAAGSSYPCFSRYETDLTAATSYTPTLWDISSGYEFLFLNGTVVNELDYDISSGSITNFPNTTTGKLTVIQFSENNLTTPTGTPVNTVRYTVNGQALYSFVYIADAFDLFANGVYNIQGTDYTTGTNTYSFTITPNNSTTVLVQQTFARAGAA